MSAFTTLADLKATIANDINRDDLSNQIADAITTAIEHYKEERTFFNETRSTTFVTVSAQSDYTVSDDADIPLFYEIDGMFLEDASGESYPLTRYDPVDIEQLLDNSAASGRPYAYAYIDQTFRLYPIPDQVYTVRPIGAIEYAAPATDGEADNFWMTKAFELIRCRAKWYLYAHKIKNPGMAIAMGGEDGDGGLAGSALSRIRRATSKRVSAGRITPTDF